MSDKEEMDNQILKLKLEKTKVKTAFTKTKNKLLQCVDTEDPNKEEIRSWQDKLDQVVDHATDIMERLSLVYQEGKDNENANKVCEEIEKMDKEFNEATQTVNDITIKMKTNTNSVEADTSPVPTGLEKDLWRQMKRVGIPLFYGDKRRYDSWRAAFDACIDKAPATREYKLLQLRQYVKGEALACIEDLGHSAVAYEAAKERLERKFGGERRKMMKFIDDLERFVPMKNEDPKQVERFADLLDIAVINMKEAEREEDLGAGSLYLSLQKKMPEGMITRFHRWIHENEETESVETLREWVNQEAKYITIASEAKHGLSSIEKSKPQKSNNRSASYFVRQKTKQISNVKECKMCRGNHNIWECEGFKSLDIPSRWTKAKEMGLCYRCLRDNHMGNECRNFKKCGINDCKKNHNRLLHQDFSTSSNLNMHAQEYVPNNRPEQHQAFYNSKSEIALRTVPVILTANGKKICVNALLDDGSTKSYINQELAAELGLQGKIEHVRVNVLNDKVESFETMSVNLGLESLNGQINMNIETFVLDNVTGSLQTVNWNDHSSKWEHLKGIKFPVMTRKSKVDILIGLDYANLHSSLHEIHGKPGDPVARLTPLGWTCVGRIDERTQTSLFCTYFVKENDDLMQVVKGFWEVDSYGTQEKCIEMSLSEKVVLRNAEEGIEYKDGRYEVKIPWKDERHLPENFQMAQKRLENTEKKIKKDPEVETLYRSTIESYIEKGYISTVTEEAKSSASKWYLPHFPVVRPEKQTTKVRIVFDAAAKCEGVSLNDCIHQGPKLQNELLNVLLRFRKKEIAVVCDIS